MTEITYGFLKGVVAFVDVWSTSKTENYSSSFIKQLQDMGAEVVSKTLNKRMVVPPPGQRLRKLECKELEERVDEDLFPARYEESKLGLKNKRTHRCMQPRDIPTNTPENDRRLKKKLDKLMEGIIPPFPIALETSPFIIDEESGIVYSPSLKRSESMALRLAEMGVKSDNLSPTGKKVSVTKPPESSSKIDKKQPELEAKAHPNLEDDIEKRQQDFKIVGKENKSTSDKIEQSTEMCSRNNMNKDNYTKKKRSLVMTSMPTEKQEVIYQLVRSLGGFTVVDNVCDSTSHVVSGTPRRTVNVLLGIARGCWILSYEWISRLQQHLSAGEYQQDLFQDQLPMFVSPNSQPPCSSLTELIRLCGGTVCRSVRQAGICIGGYKAKKPEGNVSISEQWILGELCGRVRSTVL
ncbi:hypothetical protein DNTS_028140 [Danionella cerebrum]|uniref:BRCT domain-containing protein n=1 Tax=Danionella cerebrum TaxID=2873325 RepID=A0A553RIP4_9TELE|nr:hypothetical protein DNTS_028140 [Danionella translucida]